MHERKAIMMMTGVSNAFIVLPGGFGILEELMEAITWLQLDIHEKTVILFNMDGYYNKLVVFIDDAVKNGFISNGNRNSLQVAHTVEECLRLLPFYS